MQKKRVNVLTALVIGAATLTVAGCAAATMHDPATDTGSATVALDAPAVDSAQPSDDTPPIGETGEVAGVAVSGADGFSGASDPIATIAHLPAITKLDPDLRRAVTEATEAASEAGIEMKITSGWRSTRYQQALLDQAVEQYGSMAEARKWVNTPELSTHVSGRAVDVGAWDAMRWMQENGSDFGLCQTYSNEAWHYELATTRGGTCPAMLRNSSAQ